MDDIRRVWTDIFEEWRNASRHFGLDLDDIVIAREIHVPHLDLTKEHPIVVGVCRPTEVDELHERLQLAYLGRELFPIIRSSAGVFETMHEFTQSVTSGDPECAAARLILASIHSQITRIPRLSNWPIELSRSLQALASAHLEAAGRVSEIWHHTSRYVLPGQGELEEGFIAGMVWQGTDRSPSTMRAFVRLLAREHAGILLTHRPVVFRPAPSLPAHLVAKWTIDEQEQAERNRGRLARREVAEQARQKAELLRDAAHPRWREWDNLSIDRLQHDVWTQPRSQLADAFGVSDVAIAKRCKKHGIPMPGPGFWRRVSTGKEPHPNGYPA